MLTGWEEEQSLAAALSNMPSVDYASVHASQVGDMVVLDRRATSLRELEKLSALGTVIGLDEGGCSRTYIPYLIDVLPGPRKSSPNASSVGLMELPGRKNFSFVFPFRRWLISFGGEDPAGLSLSFLDAVQRRGMEKEAHLTFVIGPCFEREMREALRARARSEISILAGVHNLMDRVSGFDLVVTSYGLTCFEALAAGVPVVLFNPSRYHRRLSRRMGIPEIGVARPNMQKLRSYVRDRSVFAGALARMAREPETVRRSLAEFISELAPDGNTHCPVCGRRLNPVIARFESRSYFRCRGCRIVYLMSFSGEGKSYDRGYFAEEYRRQYGKTYLEDFDNIKALGTGRLLVIRRILGKTRASRLLDVGCAYGPFLQAAADAGFDAGGLDVSPEAVEFVERTLAIPCRLGAFEQFDDDPFDVITMWYVLEHFRSLRAALEKISKLLKPGGLFAFSTPNFRGISGRLSSKRFLEHSPADHFSCWSLEAARRILPMYGFKLSNVRITGHHPERFPLMRRASRNGRGWRYRSVRGLSRIAGLGDTFEVYAVKERKAHEK